MSPWIPKHALRDGPIYLAIADALAADIESGRLREGMRLPTQRQLAADLGIDLTTVSRAYAEARKRGLIDGKVGQGTYVRSRMQPGKMRSSGLVDMSMNLPPRFDNPSLTKQMWASIADLQDNGLNMLMRYQEPGGSYDDRVAGAAWLSGRVPELAASRVAITAGAQGAFHAILGIIARPGDTICVEALTYPGFRTVASHLNLRLASVAMDRQGLVPDDFDRVCRDAKPKALYCTPTLHNPTTRTMSEARRREIVAVARAHDIPIIEDDTYGALAGDAPATLAALAPDLVYHVASLSKCVAPALRVAYVVAPLPIPHGRLASAIRASASTVSPLSSAIATRWIDTGLAEAITEEIHAETARRISVARNLLQGDMEWSQGAFHIWVTLPDQWNSAELATRLRSAGIGAVSADAFSVDQAPQAVRIGLGVANNADDLAHAIARVNDMLALDPLEPAMVV